MYNEKMMELSARIEQLAANLESLIEKAELWQLLFDESPDAIALFNSKMRFFLVNRKFCDLTGFTREEITNQKLSLVLPPPVRRMHRTFEKEYSNNPVNKVRRHGVNPAIVTRSSEIIPVEIDLSSFEYAGNRYYTAFIRKLD